MSTIYAGVYGFEGHEIEILSDIRPGDFIRASIVRIDGTAQKAGEIVPNIFRRFAASMLERAESAQRIATCE